ncbi:MAG: polyprenyl synthetase family protein, partial [Desulfobacterales bacterium]|nr:polyprenyl synthetase family protein [Desulfobacterales bacterium]
MSQLKQRLLSLVKDDLKAIEAALTLNLSPHLDLVSNTARHILFSGGKRLRPLLMILAARLCGYQGDDQATFSIIFEYLHAATLLHDD